MICDSKENQDSTKQVQNISTNWNQHQAQRISFFLYTTGISNRITTI